MRHTLLLLVTASACTFGQTPASTIKIKSSADFEVTADTAATSWKKTPWVQIPARDGAKKYNTKFKMLYSTTGVYCLYYCEDEKIVATFTADNSDLWNEDVVEAFFWTDESKPLYFEYELSPKNVELPILVPNDKGDFLGWLPWHYEGERKTRHAARVNRGYWVAEFFIPFALLKPLANVPARKGTRWRCNFYRIDYDQGPSEWAWQVAGTNFHNYQKFGTIVFD